VAWALPSTSLRAGFACDSIHEQPGKTIPELTRSLGPGLESVADSGSSAAGISRRVPWAKSKWVPAPMTTA